MSYSGSSCYSIFSLMCMVCRSLFVLFVLFPLAIVFSVLLRFTDIDFLFGIFKLFFIRNNDCLHFVSTSVHHCFFSVGSVVYLFSFRCYVAFFVLYLFFVCLVFDLDLCLVFVFCFFVFCCVCFCLRPLSCFKCYPCLWIGLS